MEKSYCVPEVSPLNVAEVPVPDITVYAVVPVNDILA